LVDAILGNDFSKQPKLEQKLSDTKAHPGGRRLSKRSGQFKSIEIDSPISPAMPGPGESWGSERQVSENQASETEETAGLRSRSRYNLRVQEGCENACTFCIIPQTRGLFSSRSLDRILEDFRILEDKGYEEIILSGTHLGGYGIDIGLSFLHLLESIDKLAPKARVRLSSIDPNDLSVPVIDTLKGSSVFCEHAHICLQALDAGVLKRMNRLHTLDESLEVITSLSEGPRPFAIGADLIVGFPGEGREAFDGALSLLEELPISYVHTFPYSERSGTAATQLAGSVDFSERKRRAARLRSLAQRKQLQHLESLIGQEVEIVLESEVDKAEFGGLDAPSEKDTVEKSGKFPRNGATFKGTSREFATARVLLEKTVFEGKIGIAKAGKRVSAIARAVDSNKGMLICEQSSQVN